MGIDLKTENILLHISSAYPRLLIADFGHATTYETILSHIPNTATDIQDFIDDYVPSDHGTTNFIPPERIQARLGLVPSRIRDRIVEHDVKDLGATRATLARDVQNEELQIDVWALGCE
jgi:serine/threonine protein kinase